MILNIGVSLFVLLGRPIVELQLFVDSLLFTPFDLASLGTFYIRLQLVYVIETSLIRASLIRMPHTPNTLLGDLLYYFLLAVIQ